MIKSTEISRNYSVYFFIFTNMELKQYLDATYLKLPEQAGLTEEQNNEVVKNFIQECIDEQYQLVMIRPDQVSFARKMINEQHSKVLVGTVIGFPEGTYSLEEKLTEAKKAIGDGVDELDFVCNYYAFQQGDIALVKKEILEGTQLGLSHHKVVKWIIEVAALNATEIMKISALIKNVVIANFKENQFSQVFVKSSTGFYPTTDGKPNGATFETIHWMLENASPLPVKAAGGVKTFEDAVKMIRMGVQRIGTSSAKAILHKGSSSISTIY